jgi:RNA polymerase sigma-70 factor (ECF subfamily)
MKKKQVNDGELIIRYTRGDESAFAILIERYKNRLYTAIYLIVKDSFVAEDILQETFIKVIKTVQAGRYNEQGKFLPWVSRIAHNLAIDYFRKNKRYPMVTMDDGTRNVFDTMQFAEESYEDVQIRNETHAQLRELIARLPKAQKDVLVMRHYLRMSFQEIADSSDVSINTALGRMRYALINLRKLMNNNNQINAKQNRAY